MLARVMRKKYLFSPLELRASRSLRRQQQRIRSSAVGTSTAQALGTHNDSHKDDLDILQFPNVSHSEECEDSSEIYDLCMHDNIPTDPVLLNSDSNNLNQGSAKESGSSDINVPQCTSAESLCTSDGGFHCGDGNQDPDHVLNMLDDEALGADDHMYLSTPLSAETETTAGDAMLMCLALGLRHSLPWTAMADILQMINCLFGREVVRASKYFFQKYMGAGSADMTYHLYCFYCERYLGIKAEMTEATVKCSCGKITQVSQSKSFFISFNFGQQIKEYLQDKNFVNALMYRFMRQKSDVNAYEEVFDGECYRKLSGRGQVLSYWHNLSYIFNTDGFPVGGKSGKQTCWPIYVQLSELPHHIRSKYMILAGLYVGKKDPNMQLFLHPFVQEANLLATVGIDWVLNNKTINSKIIPLAACVDSPARSKILNTTNFNGNFGWSLCFFDPERTKSGLRYTLPEYKIEERTHEDMLGDAAKALENRTLVRNKSKRRVRGIKGPTPLQNLLYFDLVKGVRPDTMHSIMLGNGKHHTTVLHDSVGSSFYIGAEVRMLTINKRLLSIKPPSSLPRVPRDFLSFSSWKANEWLAWVLFYAIPCLLELIPKKYVCHFSLLSTAVHIFLSKSISNDCLDRAHLLVLRYLFLFQHFFGKETMVFNLHLLLHIKKSIQYLGPSWTNMAFGFEGANKFLLEMKKGSSSIATEIAKKYLTFKSLPLLCEKYASTEKSVKFCENLSGRPLLRFASKCNGTVLLGKGKPVHLNRAESDCLIGKVDSHNFTEYERIIHAGIKYASESYCRSSARDDTYISVQNTSKARIQKILKTCQDGEISIVLLAREIILDSEPIFDDEFGKYCPLQKVRRFGELLAITPENISGQCVAMNLENGNFICDIPYGCYGDS